jgi:D-sedoheptulose 7-phosphate isomerase
MNKENIEQIKNSFKESISVKQKILKEDSFIVLEEAGNLISDSISRGGKLMICGNGGSAADAQHLVAEFLVRLTSQVNRQGIPAISLAQDTSTLTACLNDYGQDQIFKRVMSSLAQEGDILLAISTSGNSSNIIEALKFANSESIYCLGFLGGDGGKALKYCDSAFIVPSYVTARIQESHITAGHAMLQYVEDKLLAEGWLIKDA